MSGKSIEPLGDTICGVSKEKIRKAYYKGEVITLMDDIAAKTAVGADELAEMDKYLSQIQKEREELKTRLSAYAKTEDIKLPAPSELMGDLDTEAIAKWEKEKEQDHARARAIFESARKSHEVKTRDQWLNWGMELANLQYQLDVYRVWKDQQYRARLVNIMDGYGCSRSAAEERAKLTPEYRDYKTAVLFRELVEEVIMLCKKYYSV